MQPHNTPMLSPTQIQHWHQHGFVVLPGFKAEAEQARAETAATVEPSLLTRYERILKSKGITEAADAKASTNLKHGATVSPMRSFSAR